MAPTIFQCALSFLTWTLLVVSPGAEGITITSQNCRLSGYVAPWKRCGGKYRRMCCHSGSKCSVKDKDVWICKYHVPRGWQLAPQYWGKPTTAAPRPTPRAPPPSISPSAPNLIGDKDVTERFFSLTTVFSGVGSPYGGCGSKAEHLFDDDGKPLPFVALNFVKTRIGAAFSFDNPGSAMGAFQSGANCGRWIKMTPKRNCPNGSHTTTTVCNVGNSNGLKNYQTDEFQIESEEKGRTLYGYVADSCGDNNYWCRTDEHHLDVSRQYLENYPDIDGNTRNLISDGKVWNSREVEWSYLDQVPPGWRMNDLKFMWGRNSKWIRNGKGFYVSLIIYNTANGIGSVRQWQGGSRYDLLKPLKWLGQQYILAEPYNYRDVQGSDREFIVEVYGVDKSLTGKYKLGLNCDSSDKCTEDTYVSKVQRLS